MTSLTRRHFLKFAGSALASVGLSQLDLFTRVDCTAHILAQTTRRKLALLVGINQYPSEIAALRGCLTDVEMQYELLRHRYGFHPADILMLTSETPQKPDRVNILAAFEHHLIEQARPGDVVVFHYSGHGGLLADPDPLEGTRLNGTLVPADSSLSDRTDIMGRTLFLLCSQLQTNYFTMVLDSCHSGGGLRGNQVVRALARSQATSKPLPTPSATELQYQQKQLQKLGWSLSEFRARRARGIAKGVAIGSTTQDWLALDACFGDFHAGALTYLLTRYLWQLPGSEPLNTTFDRLSLITQELAAESGSPQIPVKEVAPGQPFTQQTIYQLTAPRPNAEAVVQAVQPNGTIVFWLGGVSSRSLEAFQPGSRFSAIDDQGKVIGEIEHTHRTGLVGYGILKSGQTPQVGTLLREKLRQLPTEVFLSLGLDSNLGSDRAAIKQGLKAISQIRVVPIDHQQPLDFILGRLTQAARQVGKVRGIHLPQPDGCVGLFTSSNSPIPNSFGSLAESPAEIVARLRPRLKMLLARQLLGLTVNGEASQLKVDIHLKSRQNNHVFTLSQSRDRSLESTDVPRPYKANSVVDIQVNNREEKLLYLAVLAIADDGIITVLHPANWDSPESAAIVRPQASTVVPMEVYGPAGFFEVLIFSSTASLRETLRGMQAIARSRGLSANQLILLDGRTRSGDDSEDIVLQTTRRLMNDLTTGIQPKPNSENARQGIDSQQTAIFSAILQVIE